MKKNNIKQYTKTDEKSNGMDEQQVNQKEQENEHNVQGMHPLTKELEKDLEAVSFLDESPSSVAGTSCQPVTNSTPKDANIGAMLKKIREAKGLSLKVVSQQTKIHLALLEALEDNQLIRLPSKTYVKGFVKSYAKILSIPQQEAIDLFENTYREYEGLPIIPHNPTQNTTTDAAPTKENNIKNKPEVLSEIANIASHNGNILLKAGISIIVVGIVGFNIKSMIERSVEDAPQELPEVISTTTKPKKIEPTVKSNETITSTAEQNSQKSTTIAPPQAVNIITKEAIKPDIKINEELTLKAFSAVEKQQKEITLSKEDLDQYLPTRFRVTPENGAESIFINATDGDSWLTYKTDSGDIKKFVLRQGRTLFLRGKEVRLFIGNTKNVKVFHNNKPIELLTSTGVKNAVFPESIKTKYMNPLFIFQKDGTVITSDEAVEKLKSQSSEKMPINPAPSKSTPVTR